jgi:PAS domain S-box-containing protein
MAQVAPGPLTLEFPHSPEEDARRIREAQLSLIVGGVQDHAVSMLDPDGAIVSFDAAAEKIKGYTFDEVRGQHFRMLFTEEDQRAGVPERELALARSTGKYQGEGYRRRKDGSRFFASVSVLPLYDSRNTLRGYVKVTHDITERVRAQRSLETLSDAGLALASSLDERELLARFSRALLKDLADSVLVDLLDAGGQASGGSIAHQNVEREARLRDVRARHPFAPSPERVALDRNGTVRFLRSVERELDEHALLDAADRAWIEALRPRSVIIVPLIARGQMLGELGLASESRGFDQRDLGLAEELARRLAVTLDHVRLIERALDGEQRLHLALEAGRMGTWEWEIEKARVSWSPMLEEIHGIPRGSFAGTFEAYQSDMHPDDRERVFGVVRNAVATRSPYQIVYRIIRPDGQVRWLEARARVLCDVNGQPTRLAGVCTDITERKREQDNLEESERRFRAVFGNALDPMLITSDERTIRDANPAACALLRTTREALVGRPVRELEIPNERDEIGPARWADFKAAGGQRGELRVLRADGTVAEVEYSATANVVPGHHLAVWRDIASRKRAEELLSFLAEASTILAGSLDYQAALSSVVRLAVPMVADWASVEMLDADGTIRRLAVAHVNPTKVELAHEIWRRWPPKPDDPSGVPQVIRSGKPEIHSEISDAFLAASIPEPELLRIVRTLGLKSSMTVPFTVRGRVIGAISFVSAESGRRFGAADLTLALDLARRAGIAVDNARLYESEQNARRNADLANRAKDDFLAAVSHELRTPLNAMLGWTRILRMGDLNPEKHARALETIERNAVNQAQLIEDLLDVSRIISGKLRLDLQSLELVHLVEQTIDTLRPASEAKHIRVVASLAASAGPIMGDANRLQQVVWNLLSNAIKFTPKNGRINLSVERVDSSLRLLVSDDGCGIKPEFLPHVFERFKQADGATTRAYGGLGLGLAISRHIVELHGGTIEVSSKGEGQGSTFTVLLPVSPLRQASRATSNRLTAAAHPLDFEPRPELAGLRVLVVDDEKDGRDLVAAVLERCGTIVTTADSAAAALAEIRTGRPDVLISDIGLPGEDGYELIRKVRALGHDEGASIPAAALTAYARAEDRRKALDAGYMMHIPKPVEPAELIAVIANLTRFAVRR